jgi:hypothetical protein
MKLEMMDSAFTFLHSADHEAERRAGFRKNAAIEVFGYTRAI